MKLVGARRLIRSKLCPSFFGFKNEFKNLAIIGLGGNIGDSAARFDKFLRMFKKDRRIWLVESSPILINAAFGYEEQDDFSNAVISLQTSMGASKLLRVLQYYEIKFKRERSFKNAPRTLDLDILYMDKKVRRSKRLCVPHSGASKRLSVIVPMGLLRSIG
ncbi:MULTISPECIES: 2-amino-4-hydroxy-6-hydroxymethyldihydropteridine diphosphokinase [unclassified Campylobacter]|uniref:2-amino-4-hydroxy-6- hydroxymethyldihydropteridine diphosphokinase n=1 Tax=unclassified Campylobacter TaxID=2593542 RepID=UPI003D34724C